MFMPYDTTNSITPRFLWVFLLLRLLCIEGGGGVGGIQIYSAKNLYFFLDRDISTKGHIIFISTLFPLNLADLVQFDAIVLTVDVSKTVVIPSVPSRIDCCNPPLIGLFREHT